MDGNLHHSTKHNRWFFACVLLWIVVFLLGLAGLARAGDECPSGYQCWYFNPEAASEGTGTAESPYKDPVSRFSNSTFITAVENAAVSGPVRILVKAGTTHTLTGSTRFYIPTNGTADHLVEIDGKSWDPDTTGLRAKIYSTNATDHDRGIWIYNATTYNGADNVNSNMYVKFTGFELHNYETTLSKTAKYIIRASNASYVWIDDCIIHGSDSDSHGYGAAFTSPADTGAINVSHNKITNCVIYSIASTPIVFYTQNDDTQSDGIATGNICYNFGWYFRYGTGIFVASGSNMLISDNYITDGYHSGSTGAIGIKLECRAAKPTNCIVERNLIVGGYTNSIFDGIQFQGTTNCTARNNIIITPTQYGFRQLSSSTTDGAYATVASTGSVYENNTHLNCTSFDVSNPSSQTIAILANNIFHRDNSTACLSDNGTITADYNNCYYNTGGTSRTCYTGGASYTYAQMPSVETTCQITDPGFSNLSDLPDSVGDAAGLAITSSGSAYQHGANLAGSFTDDFENKTRVTVWDIGAVAYDLPSGTEYTHTCDIPVGALTNISYIHFSGELPAGKKLYRIRPSLLAPDAVTAEPIQ